MPLIPMLAYLICPSVQNNLFYRCLENKNLFQILGYKGSNWQILG